MSHMCALYFFANMHRSAKSAQQKNITALRVILWQITDRYARHEPKHSRSSAQPIEERPHCITMQSFFQLIAIDTIARPFQIAKIAASSSAGPRQAQFQLLTDGELDDLINGTDSTSTKRSLKFGWQRLEAFAKFTNTSLTDISRENLDQLLSSCYASARKEDGTTYSKRSIQAIRYAVQRHYFDEQGVDICDKSTFPRSNKVFKAVLVKLKREGKGNVRHKDAVTPADMEKIQNCDDLDCNTPAGLQNKVFLDLMMYFCNRGRENIRSMKPSDFSVKTDENGRRY